MPPLPLFIAIQSIKRTKRGDWLQTSIHHLTMAQQADDSSLAVFNNGTNQFPTRILQARCVFSLLLLCSQKISHYSHHSSRRISLYWNIVENVISTQGALCGEEKRSA